MADINAAITAALDAGAEQLIVCDTHHGGGNIRIPQMLQDPRVTYLGTEHPRRSTAACAGCRTWTRRWTPSAARPPRQAPHPRRLPPPRPVRPVGRLPINGESVGEIGFEACYAAHWGVPLVLVQGDEAACREAEARFPGVVTAAVKRALSNDALRGPDLPAAHRLTAEKSTKPSPGPAGARFRWCGPACP